MSKIVLVTGACGFIGMNVSLQLLERGDIVIGVDNLNDYYDVRLKYDRLKKLEKYSSFSFFETAIENKDEMSRIFEGSRPTHVVNLAAQAGVRYSLEHPQCYIDSNITGFMNILELCRYSEIQHLVYASSSSVYGGNKLRPYSESHSVDHPVSLYAASKKANELMAHTYSHLFGLPTTGLRFFTVYGPWGRPDMALFLFTRAALKGERIEVFNHGNMVRDFTYIDDIVEGVVRVIDKPATPATDFDSFKPDPGKSEAPFRVFNIGNGSPTPLMDYIGALENSLGIKIEKEMMPMQPGDVEATAADTSSLHDWVGFKPNTPVDVGVRKFVEWYKGYYS